MSELHNLTNDLSYSAAMARLKYWRDPKPLPQENDIMGLARTWKRVFNTELGKGTVEEFIENYTRFIIEG